jgi:hypothetical protein
VLVAKDVGDGLGRIATAHAEPSALELSSQLADRQWLACFGEQGEQRVAEIGSAQLIRLKPTQVRLPLSNVHPAIILGSTHPVTGSLDPAIAPVDPTHATTTSPLDPRPGDSTQSTRPTPPPTSPLDPSPEPT